MVGLSDPGRRQAASAHVCHATFSSIYVWAQRAQSELNARIRCEACRRVLQTLLS